MQQGAQQNTYISSRLSRMRTDRETQGNTEGPWERQGALGWGIPMQFWEDRGTLGKTRALGWGIPMQF